ncbi:flavin-containing monooxygenase [Virgisporangium aurantiacum]|uniref:Putative oxidoreductase CzcO n=1 Tax=Virgisporangium aurantiacum TaxID=175570 RepID=A0A8J4E096_9ACTN|nr:NAD(P)/FAD-dependent oxidoreductase [Virgisporangium aurantiacum]GIJ56754.1 putative oxidoreductase CzcO [Virgisporangium aurantiacum]
MRSSSAGDGSFDVVVVGGGQAGLAIGWHLARSPLRFVVLEASGEIGYSWRTRWDSLTLFTSAQFDGLPGMAFPAPPDTYPDKDAVADYLARYAAAFDLPIRLNARVTALRHTDGRFEIRTRNEVLRAGQVVVATGPFQTPHVPSLTGTFDPAVTQLHSAGYHNPERLPAGRTLVVGGGNSGLQIADELAATRQVVVSAGERPAALPQRILGRDLFWWLTRLGVIRVSSTTRLGRRLRGRGEFVVGSSRRRLLRAGVEFRPRLVGASGRTAHFADGTDLDVDVVVWATGYRPDYSWISVPDVICEGRPVHRRGATDVAGLYFLGLPWQHTRGSALLGFVADDAAHVAARIGAKRDAR